MSISFELTETWPPHFFIKYDGATATLNCDKWKVLARAQGLTFLFCRNLAVSPSREVLDPAEVTTKNRGTCRQTRSLSILLRPRQNSALEASQGTLDTKIHSQVPLCDHVSPDRPHLEFDIDSYYTTMLCMASRSKK
jgi:hypothetical protein